MASYRASASASCAKVTDLRIVSRASTGSAAACAIVNWRSASASRVRASTDPPWPAMNSRAVAIWFVMGEGYDANAHAVAAIVHVDPGGDAIVFGLPRHERPRPTLHLMIASIVRLINHSSVRYLAVGALNTTVGYGLIYAAMYFANVAPAAANALGYGVGFVVSFTLNRRWTFRSDSAVIASALRFLAVMGAALNHTDPAVTRRYI